MPSEAEAKTKTRRGDATAAALLAALVVASRLPFRTQLLFNWDSVNFALALEAFDIRRHAPHPPGYLYFVGLGRAFQSILDDANTALVAESILFSALAVVALYFLGNALFDRRTGLLAALLLTASVTFWALGEVALSYTALAFFSTLAALLSYRTLSGERGLLLPLAIVYSLAGGFRPDLLLFLGPIFLAGLYGQPWRRILAASAIAALGFLAWFVPTVAFSGGLEEYWAAFSGYLDADVVRRYSVVEHGLSALAVNLRDTAAYTFYALYATTIPLGVAFLAWRRWRSWASWPGGFLLLWLSPMLLFYTFIHIGDPGYAFTFLPGLLLIPARFLAQLRGRGWALAGAVLLANTLIFLFYPRPLTAPGLRYNDAALAAKLAFVGDQYPPDQITILSYESYRHLQYYLREHSSLWIDLRDEQRWELGLPPGHDLVLFDASLAQAWDGPPFTEEVTLAPNIAIYRLANTSGILVRDGFRLRLRSP